MKLPRRRAALLLLAGLAIGGTAGAWRLRRSPPSPVAEYCAHADRNFREQRLAAAVMDYNRAMAIDPTDPRPYIGLAVLYEGVDRPDLAVVALEQLEAANPDAPHLYCRLAEAHLGADDVRGARDLGQKATRLEPDCARAFSVYGIALVRYRYWDSAAAAMQRARDLEPGDPQIREVLVDVYSQQGAFARAVLTAEEALARPPGSARLHYKAGWAIGRLPNQPGATERALRHLEKAAELNKGWFEPHAEMGRLLRAAGREREAVAAFERAWKLNPNVAGVAFNLAALYRKTRTYGRAGVMQRRFAELRAEQNRFTSLRRDYNQEPGDNSKAVTLAALEGRSGLYATALQRLRTALKADPASLSALKLYRRLDEQSRAGYPPYLPPGPGLAPATE